MSNLCQVIGAFFNFIGKTAILKLQKNQASIEHMLDKCLIGHDDKMTRFRRYKNLQYLPHHQISHLHLRNNPYREGHPRSYGECPRMSS